MEPRGFGRLSKEERIAIATKGGQAVQAEGTGHKFTHEEAQAAGRKGGEISARNRAHRKALAEANNA